MKDTNYYYYKFAIKIIIRLIIIFTRVIIDSISSLKLIENWNFSLINYEQVIVKNKY